MGISVNQVGYQSRLDAVRQLLNSHGLQTSNLSPMAFDENYQYPFNNFLFKVELAIPASSTSFPGTQPGTTAAPLSGVSALVVKLSNPEAGLNNVNRIENDVAVQFLVRKSLVEAGLGPLVPAVYAWAPSPTTEVVNETGFGWIMSEWKSGIGLDSEFSSLGLEDKKQVLEQIAHILKAIQAVKIPESVERFGGLTFDSDGRFISGEATLERGKPVDSYAEWRSRKLYKSLENASQNPVIQGWKKGGLNARIERFLSQGGPEETLAEVDLNQKGIIHGDFTTNNILFDKNATRITALLDFDWAFISNPFEEFLFSFNDIGGNTGDDDIDKAILRANFTIPPDKVDEEFAKRRNAAEAWNDAMRKSGAMSPNDIKGADKIRDILRLQMLLCPFQLGNACQLKHMNDKEIEDLRAKGEADLSLWLEKYGF
ncbi:hypothetical protein HIM_08845 [Hirsutella minnesotensis 3608]|uniref:non-specific serine/threonine protein kinase n=1 Tax=Hirsutella minnesotensis 3608 TaxID=1043627 RepID=A0A0F7ZM70_9HYPO|nr:hypothetical protein HIM_08845 [Hirsutella minnesotensis 3608]